MCITQTRRSNSTKTTNILFNERKQDIKQTGWHEDNKSYLLQFASARANEGHSVAAVVVCRHWGHAVVFVDEEGGALNGAGSPQGLVEVLAAEVIVYLQRLQVEKTTVR